MTATATKESKTRGAPSKKELKKKNRHHKFLMVKRNKVLYFFILPAFLYFLIFAYVPMYGVQIAFKDFIETEGFMASPWANPLLKHFTSFLSSPRFMKYLSNTLILSFYNLALTFPAPIILALMINEVRNNKFKKAVQNITYAPYFISMVVLVGMINLFFSGNGVVNNFLGVFGKEPVYFMQQNSLFRHFFVGSEIWQKTGYGSVVYFAALAAVPLELHEAATIDGASRFQRIIHINLPTIAPTIVVMLILAVGGIMNLSFEKVILMQTDANKSVSEIISTYVYNIGIQKAQYSLASAVGLFNNFINLILLVSVNKISKKINDTALW